LKIFVRRASFFSQKKINPPMLPKRHFALQDTFPIKTIVKTKTQKFPQFPKFCLVIFRKKIEKIYVFIFIGALGASAFFFLIFSKGK